MPSPIEKPGTNRAFSLGLGRQAKHQNEGISMCYGTNCGREGAFGTCYHPEDCIMRAIERDAEENLAARLARDIASPMKTACSPARNAAGNATRRNSSRSMMIYAPGMFPMPKSSACGLKSSTQGGSHERRHLLPALQAQVRQGREAQEAPRLLDLLVLRGTLHRRNAGHGVRERRTVVSGKGQLP